jgi:hypothetical protein
VLFGDKLALMIPFAYLFLVLSFGWDLAPLLTLHSYQKPSGSRAISISKNKGMQIVLPGSIKNIIPCFMYLVTENYTLV